MLLGMRVNSNIVKMLETDHRRKLICVQATCDQVAEYVSSDQEISDGSLMIPTERLHCEHHAEQFASERAISMPR
jgi:hypothetical protein